MLIFPQACYIVWPSHEKIVMIWTPAKTMKKIRPNQPRRGGHHETPPECPKGARVTKISFGVLWKISSSVKSSWFRHLQKHRKWLPKTYQENSTIPHRIPAILRFGRPRRREILLNSIRNVQNLRKVAWMLQNGFTSRIIMKP